MHAPNLQPVPTTPATPADGSAAPGGAGKGPLESAALFAGELRRLLADAKQQGVGQLADPASKDLPPPAEGDSPFHKDGTTEPAAAAEPAALPAGAEALAYALETPAPTQTPAPRVLEVDGGEAAAKLAPQRGTARDLATSQQAPGPGDPIDPGEAPRTPRLPDSAASKLEARAPLEVPAEVAATKTDTAPVQDSRSTALPVDLTGLRPARAKQDAGRSVPTEGRAPIEGSPTSAPREGRPPTPEPASDASRAGPLATGSDRREPADAQRTEREPAAAEARQARTERQEPTTGGPQTEATPEQAPSPIRQSTLPAPALAAPRTDVTTAPREVGTPQEALPLHAEWLAARGGGTARLRLHPPELGEVELSVRVRGSDVQVLIRTVQEAAGRAARDGRQLLVEALAARDLRVDQFEVRAPESPGGAADARDGGPLGDARDGDARARGESERRAPARDPAPVETRPTNLVPTTPSAAAGAIDVRI